MERSLELGSQAITSLQSQRVQEDLRVEDVGMGVGGGGEPEGVRGQVGAA